MPYVLLSYVSFHYGLTKICFIHFAKSVWKPNIQLCHYTYLFYQSVYDILFNIFANSKYFAMDYFLLMTSELHHQSSILTSLSFSKPISYLPVSYDSLNINTVYFLNVSIALFTCLNSHKMEIYFKFIDS